MRLFQTIVVAIVALTAAACQTGVETSTGPGYVIASFDKGQGVPYKKVALAYRGQDVDRAGALTVHTMSMSAVISVPLPPGQYEFYSFTVTGPTKDHTPLFVYSIPFTIESGKATYVGSYLALENANEPYFVVSDQQTRDAAEFTRANATTRIPAIPAMPVMAAIPDLGKVPYFRKAPLPSRKR
jgi:hypothetical protein